MLIAGYRDLLVDVVQLLEASRRSAARTINAIMIVTYWSVGLRIIELDQGGKGSLRCRLRVLSGLWW